MLSELADVLPVISESNPYLEDEESSLDSFLQSLSSKKKDELRSCFQDELKNTFYKTIDSFFAPKPNEQNGFVLTKKYSVETSSVGGARPDSTEPPIDSV